MCAFGGGAGKAVIEQAGKLASESKKPAKVEDPIPDWKKTGVDRIGDLYARRQEEDANANRSSLSTNDSRRG
tara:strand:+ start:90 stop:305 length:216 start_codon:yes stop_codon:yes gene_type:complete